MIIVMPFDNSIVKWKNDDKDEWKVAEISDLIKAYERPQGEWSLVEYKKNIDLVCPHCGYNRCNLAYGFSIEEVREQIIEDTSDDFLIPNFCRWVLST